MFHPGWGPSIFLIVAVNAKQLPRTRSKETLLRFVVKVRFWGYKEVASEGCTDGKERQEIEQRGR